MKFEEKRDVYADIASLYYLGDYDHSQIAKMYGISRFKVSRVLKRCKLRRIVTFQINASVDRTEEIAERVRNELHIKKVIVVPSGITLEESKDNVGRAAAEYLAGRMRDNLRIGVSWGSTIQTMMRFFSVQEKYRNVMFVQLSGNICTQSVEDKGYMDGSDIVRTLAGKANAAWSLYQVPYIVKQPKLKELLVCEGAIAKHVALFDTLDIVFLGIGSSIPTKSVSYISGQITREEAQKLADDGFSADVSGIRLARDGSVPSTVLDNRVLTIGAESLRNVPEKVVVACGEDKIESLVAGAKGGFIDIAVLDRITALLILNCLEPKNEDDDAV